MTDEDSSKLEFEAATSVLLEYGFSKALIKRTLKDILNRNDSWKKELKMADEAEEIALWKAQVAEMSAVLALPQVKDFLKTLAKGKEKGQEQRKEHDANVHAVTQEGEPSKKPWDEDIPELSSPSYSPPTSFSYSSDSSSSNSRRRKRGVFLKACTFNLKVYAGNKAWPLIKENGYEVVLERLISNEGSQKRKSQRKTQHGLDKERKQHELVPSAGGLSGSKIYISSSLLATPSLDIENVDIQAHQQILWTKNGLFPLPNWFKAFDVPIKEKQQKVLHLPVLSERIDKKHAKQAHCVNHCTFDALAVKEECIEGTGTSTVSEPEVAKKHIDNDYSKQGPCVNHYAFDVLAVKDEKSECIEAARSASFCKLEVVKNKVTVNTPVRTNGGLVDSLTKQISNGHSQTFDDLGIMQKADFGTGFQQLGSNSTSLKSPKLTESVHTDHADICLQQSSPSMPPIQKLADIRPSQHDVSPAALEATGTKHYRRKISLGIGGKRRKGVSKFLETLEPVAASQTMPPRTQSTEEKTSNLQSTFYATERLDIARMSACKLTRRRDGGSNPMFSRLQKCKQAGAGESLQSNQQESSDLNASESEVPAMDVDAEGGTRSKESPELPPGFWEQSVDNHRDDPVSPCSPELPPGFWNRSCSDPSPSPELPPGFLEPTDSILPDESPLLPPGFSEPLDDSSQESPRLPPGFSEPSGKAAQRLDLSPDLPPGFWEPSGTGKIFRSPESATTNQRKTVRGEFKEEKWCPKDFIECKGTPSKEVFIANIPEGFDGIEQKLYSLVREVLEGFRSVPISAILPRKIQVKGDYASVEFCCEAMAGIFVDAYHSNASAFKIDNEQLLAARNIHLMKRDIQLRLAVSGTLKGQLLDPRNAFYLGNVPSEWQNEARLFSHLASLLQGDASSAFITKTLTIYTIPDFSDVYVYFQSNVLAETFFLRCLSDREHLEEISASLFVCRNSAFLPRASRVCVASELP
ncbi:hypothetical protein L7F22_039775 [Adiantum nelumboides]|nr:hypothetical protein [Adiantum nelumboides]